MHIQRHTHTRTYVQSAHKRNDDNQTQEPGWEWRVRRDWFIWVPWLMLTCDMTYWYVSQDAFMCAMTQSRVCHDQSIRAGWHSHMLHYSFTRELGFIPTCAMTHTYVWHDSLIRVSSQLSPRQLERGARRWGIDDKVQQGQFNWDHR